jgi:SAM-dependent methyltransferase
VYGLPDVLDERFDVVVTTYGALCWLPDLPRWARIVAHFLRPGGTFCMVEMHPYGAFLRAREPGEPSLRLAGDACYFRDTLPMAETVGDTGRDGPQTVYAWGYSLGEVLTALAEAGLYLAAVREFPLAHYQQFSTMIEGDDRYWHWPEPQMSLPLLFSVRATKPE